MFSKSSISLTKVDITHEFLSSHRPLPTGVNRFSSLAIISHVIPPTEAGADPSVAPPSGKVSDASAASIATTAVSIGTIGGLLALIGAVVLFIVIHRKNALSESFNEASEPGIDFFETVTSFEGTDRYVSQENTDQNRPEDLAVAE